MKNRIKKSILMPILALSAGVVSAQERPNIVVFLVDDYGWSDSSVSFDTIPSKFNKIYKTPNMERLAQMGMKFTNAYASSVSSPTRVSLMTGVAPAKHGVTNWTLYKDKTTDGVNPKLNLPTWNLNGLQPDGTDIPNTYCATTLPEVLSANGYRTMMVGKAHFGAIDTPGENPLNLGFDYNIAGHAAGGPGNYLAEKYYGNAESGAYTKPWGVPGLEKYHGTETFLTEALTQEAINLIDTTDSSKPFFLYMSHYAVHIPYSVDPRFYQKYIDQGMVHTEAMYAAIIEGMDKSLGDIIDALEEREILDNTIILFMSDNGGLSAVGRGGEKDKHNLPLRSGKGSAYEGGIRVPMMVYGKGLVDGGTTNNSTVAIHDFMPTILELAGVKKYDTTQELDGQSFVKRLNNPKPYDRTLFWHYPNDWGVSGDGVGASSTVLDGKFKLIHFYTDDNFELYNIKNDLSEQHNLIDDPKCAKIVKKLKSKLTNYLDDVDADMVTRK